MVLSLECLCYVLSSASGLTACCYGFCCHCRCCCCCRDHFKTKVIHARSSCSSKIQVRQSEELILKCIFSKIKCKCDSLTSILDSFLFFYQGTTTIPSFHFSFNKKAVKSQRMQCMRFTV